MNGIEASTPARAKKAKQTKRNRPRDTATISPEAEIDRDEVARRAYLRFRERQEAGISGDEVSDWLAAEAALREDA